MAGLGTGVTKDLVYAAGQAAKDAITTAIIEQNRDHYNEDDVKRKIVTELQGIKDDGEALRNADFKTARDRLKLWHDSTQSMDSPTNLQHLAKVIDHASLAFNTVSDPLNKLTAVSMLVYATYHNVALATRLQDGSPDWTAGKMEAQQRFTYYMVEMKELEKAAEEELGINRRLFFMDRVKRRKVLLSFINLSATVFALYPSSHNVDHPRFQQLEGAVRRAIEKDQENMMLSARVGHITLTEPLEAGTLRGHTDFVSCCAVFAAGARAISGSWDNTLKVWNLESGEAIHTLVGHTGTVVCCAVFADGTRAISGSGDNTLKVWNLRSREEMHTLKGHTKWVNCCAVFADGTRAISGSFDNTLKVWDLGSGEAIHTLKGHTMWVSCCAVFADGTRAISGSWDKTLKVWDLRSGEEIHTLEGHTDSVYCCALFANGTRAISGSHDTTLQVWDLESGEEIHTLEGHTDWVRCCAVLVDCTRAISGSDDNTLKVWDLGTGEKIHTLEGHTSWILCCAVFANGTRAISGSHDNTLKVWDLVRGEVIHTLEGHTDWVWCCTVFADGTRAISGSDDKTLKVWNLPHSSCSPSVPMLSAGGNTSDSS